MILIGAGGVIVTLLGPMYLLASHVCVERGLSLSAFFPFLVAMLTLRAFVKVMRYGVAFFDSLRRHRFTGAAVC